MLLVDKNPQNVDAIVCLTSVALVVVSDLIFEALQNGDHSICLIHLQIKLRLKVLVSHFLSFPSAFVASLLLNAWFKSFF